MLTDDGFALKRNIFDARIQIGQKERLIYLEVFERLFSLVIDFTATSGHGINAHSLFKVRIADSRANRICIGVPMPDDVNGFIAAFH